MLGEIAARHGRRIVMFGRGVETHARVARATARATGEHAGRPYLEWPPSLTWPAERVRELPRNAVLAVSTGSQGEAAAALARLARGEHSSFDLQAGDTVVLSSRVIPGNEGNVGRVMTELLRREVQVRSWWSDRSVHVSGHAHRDEQRRLIELVRPQAFVPVHGTLHHLTRHAALATEAGVAEVCVLENGDLAEIDSASIRKIGRVAAGRVAVCAGRPIAPAVLLERGQLAESGGVHVSVPVDASGRVSAGLDVSSRGVLDEAVDGKLIALARAEALAAARELGEARDEDIADAVRGAVRRTLGRALGFRPLTWVTVHRVQP
jgi:ribonuclease J